MAGLTLASLELGGDGSAARPPRVGTGPGGLARGPCGSPLPPPLPATRQAGLPHTHLSYLLCRSFSICGRTVVHRSSFHRELGRGPGTSALSARPRALCPLRPPWPLTLSG